MTPRYAEKTRVSVDRSRVEVQRVLRRYGATRVVEGWEVDKAVVQFEMGGRVVRLDVPMPTRAQVLGSSRRALTPVQLERACEQAERQRWRAFVLLLKAKLESCTLGLTQFDEEFLAGTVLDNGRTIAESMRLALSAGTARLAVPALPAKGAT